MSRFKAPPAPPPLTREEIARIENISLDLVDELLEQGMPTNSSYLVVHWLSTEDRARTQRGYQFPTSYVAGMYQVNRRTAGEWKERGCQFTSLDAIDAWLKRNHLWQDRWNA